MNYNIGEDAKITSKIHTLSDTEEDDPLKIKPSCSIYTCRVEIKEELPTDSTEETEKLKIKNELADSWESSENSPKETNSPPEEHEKESPDCGTLGQSNAEDSTKESESVSASCLRRSSRKKAQSLFQQLLERKYLDDELDNTDLIKINDEESSCDQRNLKAKNKRFQKEASLKKKKMIQCTQSNCKFLCSSKSHLYKHLLVHSGIKAFECGQCGKKFSQKPILNQHMRIHTDEKPYECTYCDKKFRQSSNLKQHLHNIHAVGNTKMPYKCTQCDHKCSTRPDLYLHMCIHTGEEPFQCPHCDKIFSQSRSLKQHIGVHTTETAYQCANCDKKFSQPWNLNQHMLVHTGQMPYQCTQCDYKCRYTSGLKKHSLTHTGYI